MAMIYTLDWWGGYLCVVGEALSYDEPQRERTYWPVMPCREAQAKPLIGSPCEDRGGGLFIARVKGGVMDIGLSEPYQAPDYDQTITLPQGGGTAAIHSETIPVPCPKVKAGTQTRWKYPVGWQKYTKTKGWVSL